MIIKVYILINIQTIRVIEPLGPGMLYAQHIPNTFLSGAEWSCFFLMKLHPSLRYCFGTE